VSSQSATSATLERATRRLFTKVLVSLTNNLADEELTVGQLTALHLVDDLGSVHATELAERLHRSPSAVSRMVEDLVQRGWLLRAEDPDDRRVKRLSLSDEGQRFVQRTGEGRARVIRETLEQNAPRVLVAGILKAMERFLARERR
jgi:DNA-binding MarR family transcriptional regulator